MVPTALWEKPMAAMSETPAAPAPGWRKKRRSAEGDVTRSSCVSGETGSVAGPCSTQPGGRNASTWYTRFISAGIWE